LELAVELVVGALAATRFAQLVIQDTFGPIRDAVNWIKYRYPDADDAYYESEVVGNSDVGWIHRTLDIEVVEGRDPDGILVFYPVEPHPIGTLLSCVRCLSVWTGLTVTVLILLAPMWVTLPILLPFAFSQIAILLAGWE